MSNYGDWLSYRPWEKEQEAYADWCSDQGLDPDDPLSHDAWDRLVEQYIENAEADAADRIYALRKDGEL